MGKNNVLIYTEWLEDLEDIGDLESGILFQNILRYQIGDMDLLPMDRVTNTVFRHIKRCIDRDNKAYKEKCEKNSQIMKERWRKQKENDTNVYERIGTYTNATDNDNEKDNDKDNDNENEKDKDKDIKEKGKGKTVNKRPRKSKSIYNFEELEREILCK